MDWLLNLDAAQVGRALAGMVLVAFATVLFQFLFMPLAHRLDLLDHPVGRKDHAHPTPITGGIAMALGMGLICLLLPIELGNAAKGFILGAGLLMLVGLLDDKYDLPWWLRIVAQVLAALSMVWLGDVRVDHLGGLFGLSDTRLGGLAVPFTVVATVGLINALNMSDGADGMAGMLALAALAMVFVASLYAGNMGLALGIGFLMGGLIGFLAFNLRTPWRSRAKVFMGNAGSAVIGFAIAWACFRLTQNPHFRVSPALALWVVPIPVMDCLVLIIRRLRARQSPFIADRNHIHHLMQDAGFCPTHAALLLAAFSLLCGLAAGEALRLDVAEPVLVLAFVALCLLWFLLTRERTRAIAFFARLRRLRLLPWPLSRTRCID